MIQKLYALLIALSLSSPVLANESTEAIAAKLAGAKLKAIPQIVVELEVAAGEDPETVLPLMQAMLDGRLYFSKENKALVFADKIDSKTFATRDPFTLGPVSDMAKKDIRKVRVNNRVRTQLRSVIARLTLFSEDPDTRLKAANNMLARGKTDDRELVEEARKVESDADVIELLDLYLAIDDLDKGQTQAVRLAAINTMEDSLQPTVRNSLKKLLKKDSDGNYLESDTLLVQRAQKALRDIDEKIEFYEGLEQLFFGLSLGSVLLLVATGLAITFGVMGVINMAHGELMMLGAYTTYVVQQALPNYIEYSVLLAIPAAFCVSGFVGILIERGVIRFLHGRPLETLLATFGISLILQQAVRTVFSPLNRQVQSPEWMSGSLEISSVLSITNNRLYIFIFALLVFGVLQLILKRTSLGLHVRAVSQNRSMAKAIGIRTEWVDAMTFGLGSGIAGIAGVALSQLTNVGPNLGQSYIIDSFMVVVFGGVGNLWGTLVGGFSLGIANKLLEPVTGAVLANIMVLVFIILFIQKRPKGLFPQRGRAAE